MLVQHYSFNCQNALFLTVYVPTLIRGHYWSVWLEYSVISQRLYKKRNETMHQVKVWCEHQDFFYLIVTISFEYCFFYLFYFLFNFFARISLKKNMYFMLQSAISFMDILCIQLQFSSCWELKLLIKIIPPSEMFISQLCCYISVTFIYKPSVHNLFYLFLHCLSSMNWGHLKKSKSFLYLQLWIISEWSCLAIQKLTQTLVMGKEESWGWQYLVLWDIKLIYLVKL